MVQASPTLWLPKYSVAQHFLRIMQGTSYSKYQSMWNDIVSQVGNNQNNVNWTDPDGWIPCRLENDSCDLAMRLWRGSENLINPRWSYEIWRFVSSYKFAEIQNDSFVHTPRGLRFISNDETLLQEIDENEGVLFLLGEIADRGPGARRDFIGNYSRYFQHSTSWKDSSINSSFSVRLKNLAERNLITKSGNTYQITDVGLSYFQRISGGENRLSHTVELVVSQKNKTARQKLGSFLKSMDPFQFEHLIARLYEAMGYDNVELTPYLSDQGVDIKADIVFGISSVHEVIQVKRQKGNIGQPIVSQLRGAMPLFDAIRGSIITTGGFSKKAKEIAVVRNAPPISLIDGERLLDLLIEYNMGIHRREIRILEFDKESLRDFESEENVALPEQSNER